MKKYLIPLIVIVLALSFAAFAVAVSTSQNQGKLVSAEKQILLDGDMEKSGTSDWTPNVANTLLTKESGAKEDGQQILRIYNDQGIVGNCFARQTTALTIGKTYRITGWARSPTGRPRVMTGLVSPIAWEGKYTTEWQRVDGIGVAGSANFTIGVFSLADDSYSEWDDILVTEYTAPQANAEQQLLADGDMELSDTSEWSALSSTISKESGAVEDGIRVFRITTTDSGNAAYQTTGILTLGETYRVTGWVRTDSSRLVAIGDRAASGRFCSFTAGTDWTRFDCTGTAGHTQFRLAVGTASAGQWGEFDDIVVTEYMAPAANKSKQTLADGDMEKADTSDWTPYTLYTAISKLAGAKEDGQRIMRIENTDAQSRTIYVKQDILTAGKTYRVTGWVRLASSGEQDPPRVYFGSTAVLAWIGVGYTTEWQRIDGIATSAGAPLYLWLGSCNVGSYYEVDDIMVTEL